MKKILFYDFLNQKPPPKKLWQYYIVSALFHTVMLAIVVTIPMEVAKAVSNTHREQEAAPVSRVVPGEHDGPVTGQKGTPIEPVEETEKKKSWVYDEYYWGSDEGKRTIDTVARDTTPVNLTAPSGQVPPVDGVVDLTEQNPNPTVNKRGQSIRENRPRRNMDPQTAIQYKYTPRNRPPDLIDMDESIRLYKKPFKSPLTNPTSSFRTNIGSTSYTRVRRHLRKRELPPTDTIKIEEMINYFSYDYPQPTGEHPFSVTTEINTCPWAPSHRLLHIGIQGKSVFGNALQDSMYYIAKHIRVQVEFNPETVKAYRLIGYANRKPRFGNLSDIGEVDDILSGELTAGQSLTTLYEIIPRSPIQNANHQDADNTVNTVINENNKPLTWERSQVASVNISYKVPISEEKKQVVHNIQDQNSAPHPPSENFTFSASVAQFGILLKNTEHTDDNIVVDLINTAIDAMGKDEHGHRKDFINMIERYRKLNENNTQNNNHRDSKQTTKKNTKENNK